MRIKRFSLGMKMTLVASPVLGLIVVGLASLFLSPKIQIVSRVGWVWFLILIGLLTVLVTLATFLALSYLFVDRPIRELIKIMGSAEKRDFLSRAPVYSGDVIGELSRSFNLLLERITTLDAFKLETERELISAQEELKYKKVLEEKGRIIEKTNQDLQARLKELSLLHDFSHRIASTLELDDFGGVLSDFIVHTLGFQEFVFLVLNEEQKRLEVRVAEGFSEESNVYRMSFGPGEGITGRVWEGKETTYIPDTRMEVHYLYYKGERRQDGSFLSIPLLFKGKVQGVLNFFRPGVNQFSAEEIQFLNTLAVEIGIALVNIKLYSKTRELSVRDELTQLYNRRHFQQTLPLEIKRAQRFGKELSLLMIDMDHFKKYNDTYGHLEGDQRLKEFAFFVISRIREVDFMARFGGEEFVVVLPNTAKRDAVNVGEKLRLALRDHPFKNAQTQPGGRLTMSVGVASYPEDGLVMEELIDVADIALYQAKTKGRDCVIVYQKDQSVKKLA